MNTNPGRMATPYSILTLLVLFLLAGCTSISNSGRNHSKTKLQPNDLDRMEVNFTCFSREIKECKANEGLNLKLKRGGTITSGHITIKKGDPKFSEIANFINDQHRAANSGKRHLFLIRPLFAAIEDIEIKMISKHSEKTYFIVADLWMAVHFGYSTGYELPDGAVGRVTRGLLERL